MSPKSYISIETTLQNEIKSTAWAEMQKAGDEEKENSLRFR